MLKRDYYSLDDAAGMLAKQNGELHNKNINYLIHQAAIGKFGFIILVPRSLRGTKYRYYDHSNEDVVPAQPLLSPNIPVYDQRGSVALRSIQEYEAARANEEDYYLHAAFCYEYDSEYEPDQLGRPPHHYWSILDENGKGKLKLTPQNLHILHDDLMAIMDKSIKAEDSISPYLNKSHHFFSTQLAAGVQCWLAIQLNKKSKTTGKGPIEDIRKWLDENYSDKEISSTAKGHLSSIINSDLEKSGGNPGTPDKN